MAWPTPSFAALTGTQPLSLFDAMFAQVAAMISIPCTASGSATAIVLTPTGTAPSLAAYATGNFFNFKAVGNSTSAVTIQFMALAALPLYFADGTTQVTTQIVSGRNYIVGFDAALNSGNGAYYLPMPQMPGTVGQVLTMASSGPAYATPVNSAMVLLNTLTASNSTTLDDTTNFTATYSSYDIVFDALVPITNNVSIACRPQVSGTFQTTSIGTIIDGVGASLASAANTGFLVGVNVADTANLGVSGTLRIQNVANSTSVKWFYGHSTYADNVGGINNSIQSFAYGASNAAVTGIRFITSSGNISTGTVRIYGIA